MNLLLRDACYIDWRTCEMTRGDMLVETGPGGRIQLSPSDSAGADVLDCHGRIVTRSFAIGHHHIYSTLARGMPAPAEQPGTFNDILRLIWWNLDKKLDGEMIRASALACAVEAARSGCTFIIDHHASPGAAQESLHIIDDALHEVGVSSLLCYELSDRDGPEALEAGLSETERYLGSRRGLVGLHASFTVSDDLLHRAMDVARRFDTGVHIHVGEAESDQQHCQAHHGCSVTTRLSRAGALESSATILAHCLYVDDEERRLIRESNSWIALNTQSNQNNAVGRFRATGLGDRIVIGSDGMHSDPLSASRASYLDSCAGREGMTPADAYKRLRRVHDYLSVNDLPGDDENNLIVLDYRPPTPITPENWPSHVAFGLRSCHVQTVISDGRVIVDDGQLTLVDEGAILSEAREQAAPALGAAMSDTLSIDSARLYGSIEALGAIGAFTDEPTGLVGVCRLALSDEDRQARDTVVATMRELGLSVSIDQIGNIYGRRDGRDNSLDPVMFGSHVDSVPSGGRFDGALGVLGALEVVRTLTAASVKTLRPLVVGVFTDEEGCRFGTDMLGSAVATGRIALSDALALQDKDGLTVGDELQRAGYDGAEPIGGRRPFAFVECHVEQGPTLIREGFDLGVVTKVQSISWHEAVVHGRAAHAGATPTEYRIDAGLAASRMNVRLREMVDGGEYGQLRATMGVMRPSPDMINVIPGRMLVTIDLRNPDDEMMRAAETELHAMVGEVQERDRVRVEIRQTARTDMVPFDSTVQDVIESCAAARGLRHHRLFAGAGHDAQEWASICPTAMIFVPGEYDGISHNPREFSTPKQCTDGINVLLDTILELAERP